MRFVFRWCTHLNKFTLSIVVTLWIGCLPAPARLAHITGEKKLLKNLQRFFSNTSALGSIGSGVFRRRLPGNLRIEDWLDGNDEKVKIIFWKTKRIRRKAFIQIKADRKPFLFFSGGFFSMERPSNEKLCVPVFSAMQFFNTAGFFWILFMGFLHLSRFKLNLDVL